MNRKKVLSNLVLVTLLIGVGFTMSLFIASLHPSAKADANLFRLDISNIENGEYEFFDHPRYESKSGDFEWAVMIYRHHSGKVSAYDLMHKDSLVGLPDLFWHRPAWSCKKFGPTVISGKVDESKPIKCHDNIENLDYWQPDLEWNIDGNSTKGGMKDMYSTKGIVEGKYFVFGKSS